MISHIGGSTLGATYSTQNGVDKKSIKPNSNIVTNGDGSARLEKLKESINSGEYKIDLSSLAEKIADDLM